MYLLEHLQTPGMGQGKWSYLTVWLVNLTLKFPVEHLPRGGKVADTFRSLRVISALESQAENRAGVMS